MGYIDLIQGQHLPKFELNLYSTTGHGYGHDSIYTSLLLYMQFTVLQI